MYDFVISITANKRIIIIVIIIIIISVLLS